MGILRIKDLGKAFGIEELFHNVTFDVARGDKIGFVGPNGAGKSTLMRCLLGLEEYDNGSISIDSADTIGYMQQQFDFKHATLHEELLDSFSDILALGVQKTELEKEIEQASTDEQMEELMKDYSRISDRFEQLGGYDYESRLRRVAFGLGFKEEDFDKSPSLFSGGQRTRICLAKALLREPDFLFLDEPTNHLDIEMIEWLEGFLSSYKGGVLLISHDRFFLDKVATKILDLDNKTTVLYDGNYTTAMEVKAQRHAALESAYAKQQEHIRETQEFIRRYKAGVKAKQARGREKQLQRLERIILPPTKTSFNFFMFHKPDECAERVLELDDVSVSFDTHKIFEHLSLLIRRGDGVAIVGPNGAGKTTLLRLILGELESPTGRIKIGSRVKIGYYSQQHEGLTPSNTVFDEILSSFGLNDEQARSCLGSFLFKGDDVYKRVSDLSGGEKSRLALLKLMLTGANFLVLDEPTNHLDIPAKEAIEEAIMAFPGTFIVVSHDRYFLDKVTNFTCELSNGVLTQYNGDYSYYREKKLEMQKELEEQQATAPKKTVEKKAVPTAPKKETSRSKTNYAVLSTDKLTMLIQRCEATIAMFEAELKGLEYQMNDPILQQDPKKSHEIAQAYAQKEQELDDKYQEWEKLTDQLSAK
ncbi:ABC-F family ATP-binding cassette domain-containing protein [Megamonas hypermegale]|uniref:ABC-F family ATP-binding cassette domain-containing protein n=1 Tax=Megamonas hypermegale TaxID=158847 RepID=UPI00255CE408|nr:ABC-F family ATP-binding cassette domain-containing protein [Megamonas hypermegale]